MNENPLSQPTLSLSPRFQAFKDLLGGKDAQKAFDFFDTVRDISKVFLSSLSLSSLELSDAQSL